jgi:mannosylglycoprotein endo-beta-mannosidase
MLNCANEFYSNLYKAEEISPFHLEGIISKIETKQIPEEIQSNLDCEITADEVRKAIFQMNKNKSPGQDGLTVEFYQTYWDVISTDLIDVIMIVLTKVQCVTL